MKNKKNIERLREELLKVFSSSIQLSDNSMFNSESIQSEVPASIPTPTTTPQTATGQSKDININVSVQGAGSKDVYDKSVEYVSKNNTYNINLKKNDKPLETILNTSTNFISSVSPLYLNPAITTSENTFHAPQVITKQSPTKTSKKETTEKNIASMTFISQEPYNFSTDSGSYHVSNYYPKTSEVYKNNFSSIDYFIRPSSNSNTRYSNTNVVENIINKSSNTNVLENIVNKSSNNNVLENIINKSSNTNVLENIINKSSNTNVLENIVNKSSNNNVLENIVNKSSNNNVLENIVNKSSNTNVVDGNTTSESNTTTNQNVIEHNRQQIFSPNFTFAKREMYYTIDPTNKESITEIKNMTFNDMKTRMVNKIQARTIVNNKENKMLIPAFAEGGMVKGPSMILAGEKNPEMIVPMKSNNSTQTMKADSKTFLEGGNVSQKIDSYPNDANASQAIEKNMVLKTTPSTKKQLDYEELNDSNQLLSNPKKSNAVNASKSFFDNKLIEATQGKPKSLDDGLIDFSVKNKNTFIQQIKTTPVWRTQHM